jgi:hypothetical protein
LDMERKLEDLAWRDVLSFLPHDGGETPPSQPPGRRRSTTWADGHFTTQSWSAGPLASRRLAVRRLGALGRRVAEDACEWWTENRGQTFGFRDAGDELRRPAFSGWRAMRSAVLPRSPMASLRPQTNRLLPGWTLACLARSDSREDLK